MPSFPREVGSVPSFPFGAGPFGMEPDFGAGAVDIGDAPFFRSACALRGNPPGGLAAGSGSAPTAGAAQKVAATISADNCRLFMEPLQAQLAALHGFAAELAGRRGLDAELPARRGGGRKCVGRHRPDLHGNCGRLPRRH